MSGPWRDWPDDLPPLPAGGPTPATRSPDAVEAARGRLRRWSMMGHDDAWVRELDVRITDLEAALATPPDTDPSGSFVHPRLGVAALREGWNPNEATPDAGPSGQAGEWPDDPSPASLWAEDTDVERLDRPGNRADGVRPHPDTDPSGVGMSVTNRHDVGNKPTPDTDPSGLGDEFDLDVAWEALENELRDDGWPGRVANIVARHRPIIEAAIRARLEVNINTLVREAHEARAAIQESRAGGGLDVERLARAMHVALGKHTDHTGAVCPACHEDAVDTAREYAALSPSPEPETKP